MRHLHVACAIIERDGLVFAAQRSATGNMPLKWEFPGGKIEPCETAEACLQRELVEELGITVHLRYPLPLTIWDYGDVVVTLYPFVCDIVSGVVTLREHAEVAWLTVDKLPALDWAAADRPVLENYLAGKGGSYLPLRCYHNAPTRTVASRPGA